jgi:putative transposase
MDGREALPTIWRVPDELWAIAEPIVRPAGHLKGGRPWTDTRRALDGVLYVLRTGCQWRALPREYGAATTVHDRFQRWVADGSFRRLWRACLRRYGEEQGIVWAWQAADGALVKAPLPPKRAPRRRRSAPTPPTGAKTAASATC